MTVQTKTASKTARRVECPSCGKKAKRVSPVTLGALLKDEFARPLAADGQSRCDSNDEGCQPVTGPAESRLTLTVPSESKTTRKGKNAQNNPSVRGTGWRFCDSPECDVVYFSEKGDTRLTKSQLKVPVGVKESSGERPLCYCFGHSVGTIKEELRTKGRSDALEDIRARMEEPGCLCEIKNPSGSCCLASVTKGIQIAQEETGMNDSDVTPVPAAKSSTGRGEKIAGIGTVVSAILASACCWLPLALLAAGVSGAGIAAALDAYRPLFIVVTFGFLGAAFYFTYRPKKAAAAAGHGCAAEPTEGESCCPPTGSRRFNMMALNKMMLWVVTVLAVAFLFFPSYVGLLFGTGNAAVVTENMNRALFQIEGMTCEGCATTVAQAIRQVPGVLAVEVSYKNNQAIVGVESGQPLPKQEILSALKKAGYDGRVLPDRREQKSQVKGKQTMMLIDLSADARWFRKTFNAAKGKPRIVMIVSPG